MSVPHLVRLRLRLRLRVRLRVRVRVRVRLRVIRLRVMVRVTVSTRVALLRLPQLGTVGHLVRSRVRLSARGGLRDRHEGAFRRIGVLTLGVRGRGRGRARGSGGAHRVLERLL